MLQPRDAVALVVIVTGVTLHHCALGLTVATSSPIKRNERGNTNMKNASLMQSRAVRLVALATVVVILTCGLILSFGVARPALAYASAVDRGGVTYKVSGKVAQVTKVKASKKSVTIRKTVKIGGKGYKVSKIKARAFKGTKVKTITIKTPTLSKKGVRGCLKNSKVSTIKVPAANVSRYTSIFKKANSGKKVAVKKLTSSVPSKKRLKAILGKATKKKALELYYGDFDSDGTREAFAITGEKTTSYGTAYRSASLWYVTKNGATQLESDICGYSSGLQNVGKYKLLSINHYAGGSGGTGVLYGVKNGRAREVKVAGTSSKYKNVTYYGWNFEMDKQRGQMRSYASVWDNQYHQYAYCYYDFNETTFTLTLKSMSDLIW